MTGKNIALFWLVYPPAAMVGELAQALNEAHLNAGIAKSGLVLERSKALRLALWSSAFSRWCCIMALCFTLPRRAQAEFKSTSAVIAAIIAYTFSRCVESPVPIVCRSIIAVMLVARGPNTNRMVSSGSWVASSG